MLEYPLVSELDLQHYRLGSAYRLRLHVVDLPDGSALNIPITVLIGRRRRPKVVVVAGVHGDEYEGPRAILQLGAELDPDTLDGTVVLVPFANPLAYNAGSRETREDGLNLNRIFPGRPDGTVSQRLAHSLIHGIIAQADLAIDLHSAGQTGLMLPMSGFREARDDTARRSALAAAALGLEVFWMMYWAPGTLSTALNQLGIPAAACELGGLGMAEPTDVALYREGIVRCLRHIGLLNPPLTVELPATVRTMDPVTAPGSGLIDLAVDLRQEVQAGDLLARLLDPWGGVRGEIVAPCDGMVVHKRVFRMVRAGETIVSLGRLIDNPVYP